jgi:hypothetical protein
MHISLSYAIQTIIHVYMPICKRSHVVVAMLPYVLLHVLVNLPERLIA